MDSPQQVCETYPAFQNKVFEMALDPDPVMNGVALDTLGLLGSTVEGKQVLQKTGQFFPFLFFKSYRIANVKGVFMHITEDVDSFLCDLR